MSLSRARKTEVSPRVEINIVPLVDVSLVLLIIFMVTATFVKTSGIRLQLPTSTATQQAGKTKREVVIGVAADGAFRLGDAQVSEAQLDAALRREAVDYGVESRITVQGDERAAHGRVVRAMTLAQLAGFSRLVIATRQEQRDRGSTR